MLLESFGIMRYENVWYHKASQQAVIENKHCFYTVVMYRVRNYASATHKFLGKT
jgi:hypothetical protein